MAAWRVVMMIASGCAAVSAVIAVLFVRTGPQLPVATRFDWRYFARVWTEPALRRARRCPMLTSMDPHPGLGKYNTIGVLTIFAPTSAR